MNEHGLRITRVEDGQTRWYALEGQLIDALASHGWVRDWQSSIMQLWLEPESDDPAERYTALCEDVPEQPQQRHDSTFRYANLGRGWWLDLDNSGDVDDD